MFLSETANLENRIIVGDTTIDILDKNLSLVGHRFLDTLFEYGFINYLYGGTRFLHVNRALIRSF